MSKVAITGNASGTGVFTVASPNSNVDRTLTLPDESGTVDTLQRSGNVLQVVNFQTGAMATGATLIPVDDTIPQNTEGVEFMTLAITPTSAGNILIIDFELSLSAPASAYLVTALFQDATVNALKAAATYQAQATVSSRLNVRHRMTAGTTSATTFRVRGGLDRAGTTTFNGNTGVRIFGGVAASSITITEVTP